MSDKWSWNKTEMWRHRHVNNQFTVEICHSVLSPEHCRSLLYSFASEGAHHWNVYAYIYKTHPLFKKLVADGRVAIPAGMPLHNAASLFSYCRHEGEEITAVKIGSDYNHLDDERFTRMSDQAEAARVFLDAEALIKFLEGTE